MQQLNAVVVASEQAVDNMFEARQPGIPTVAVERHAHIYLGGKSVEIYHFGRAHTNGDVVVLLPRRSASLAAGDMFTYGDATPELVDYSGGGSSKEWTEHARLGVGSRFRRGRARPRRRDDEAGDAQVPRQHAAAAEPRARARRPEKDARRHREDAAGRVSLGRPAPRAAGSTASSRRISSSLYRGGQVGRWAATGSDELGSRLGEGPPAESVQPAPRPRSSICRLVASGHAPPVEVQVRPRPQPVRKAVVARASPSHVLHLLRVRPRILSEIQTRA